MTKRLFLRRVLAYTIGLPVLIVISLTMPVFGIVEFIVLDDLSAFEDIKRMWIVN